MIIRRERGTTLKFLLSGNPSFRIIRSAVASPGRARESPVPGHHQRRAVGCRSSHTSKANPPPHAKMTELGSCKLG